MEESNINSSLIPNPYPEIEFIETVAEKRFTLDNPRPERKKISEDVYTDPTSFYAAQQPYENIYSSVTLPLNKIYKSKEINTPYYGLPEDKFLSFIETENLTEFNTDYLREIKSKSNNLNKIILPESLISIEYYSDLFSDEKNKNTSEIDMRQIALELVESRAAAKIIADEEPDVVEIVRARDVPAMRAALEQVFVDFYPTDDYDSMYIHLGTYFMNGLIVEPKEGTTAMVTTTEPDVAWMKTHNANIGDDPERQDERFVAVEVRRKPGQLDIDEQLGRFDYLFNPYGHVKNFS